jgi:hypothetical protein
MPDDDTQTESTKLDDWDRAVWSSIMADSKSRYTIERLLDRCGSRQQRYLNDGDALGAAWRDGRASIGDFIEGELERFCPDLLLKMIRERRARLGRAIKAQRDAEAAEPKPFQGVTDIERMADAQREQDEAKQVRSNGHGASDQS